MADTADDIADAGGPAPTEGGPLDPHSRYSVLRERILEHLFVGELLRLLWGRQIWDVEVLRSEFDAYGYDLVLSRKDVVRHVQLKAVRARGRTRDTKIALSLGDKPSGCIVCMVVDDQLAVDHFLWFGGCPGQPLPGIIHNRIAKQVKGNAKGEKLERPLHRLVRYSDFERVDTMAALLDRLLFATLSPSPGD